MWTERKLEKKLTIQANNTGVLATDLFTRTLAGEFTPMPRDRNQHLIYKTSSHDHHHRFHSLSLGIELHANEEYYLARQRTFQREIIPRTDFSATWLFYDRRGIDVKIFRRGREKNDQNTHRPENVSDIDNAATAKSIKLGLQPLGQQTTSKWSPKIVSLCRLSVSPLSSF